ncbi:MAG: thioredoxin family protein, partial [Candidatus Micrarchaeota archaeon]|nr:thioredoxin family protein [Candidatus Micrarchaeota archaeon]
YVLNSSDEGSQNHNAEENNIKNRCEMKKVYFIYADWCPHCQRMKPLVSQLENEGYQFVKIDSQNPDAVNLAKECLTGIAQLKYIPEFVCISNRQTHVGAFSNIDEMRKFVSNCNQGSS